jgi:hypothetical protein
MKRKLKYSFGILSLLLVIHLFRNYTPLDGFSGMFFASMFGEDTIYAAGYSDTGFRSIQIGMTQNEVFGKIGTPLNIWTNDWAKDGSIGMRWTKSAHDSNYRCRVLQFIDSKVVDKHSEYYLD